MSRLLTAEEITRQVNDLDGWSVRDAHLCSSWSAPDFLAGVRFVEEVAADAVTMDHFPDIDIRGTSVHFALITADRGGLTQLDIELAHQISQAAARCRVAGAAPRVP